MGNHLYQGEAMSSFLWSNKGTKWHVVESTDVWTPPKESFRSSEDKLADRVVVARLERKARAESPSMPKRYRPDDTLRYDRNPFFLWQASQSSSE
ncbi:Uncharacterised protein [Acinetobacter baumannii]|nr:Uncharacterised protein [Acinetobacter baumannii]